MQNDLKYTVRSREIVDLMSAMRSSRLTLSPYFQRNLVWRDAHKRDFIDTILNGYPFPQIFLARGPIDLDTMEASQAVVDGQQRLTAIRDYINGKLDVAGRLFKDLPAKDREEFLKYEVAVIDFDLDVGDPRLKDVFHRLNRTFYALSAIEKIASEYSASEFLLVARILCGEILREPVLDASDELGDIGGEGDADIIEGNIFSRDPGIDEATWSWLVERAEGPFASLILNKPVFSNFEVDRKVPLMFALNTMCTYLTGYYERNDRVRRFLDEKATAFPEREDVLEAINAAADFVQRMELGDKVMWWNKANLFTLLVELSRHPSLRDQPPAEAATKIMTFAQSIPDDYALAAKEAVGRKPQRELRGQAVRTVLS